jgi:hypothetical protein
MTTGTKGTSFFGTVTHELIACYESGQVAKVAPPVVSVVAASAPVDTEVAQRTFDRMRAATVLVVDNPQSKPCSGLKMIPEAASSLCIRAASGPLVITDVEWSAGCAAETFVVAGDVEQPLWFLRADEARAFATHGAALVIPGGKALAVGHRLPSKAPLKPSPACAVTWAGWRP